MDDHDERPRIRRVFMSGDFGYTVGLHGVTDIKFGSTSGHMAALRTVEVYKDYQYLHFEIPFTSCQGVEYFPPTTPRKD